MVEVLLVEGDVKTARNILDGARKRRDPDGSAKAELDQVEQFLRHEQMHPGWNKARVATDSAPRGPAVNEPATRVQNDRAEGE